MRFDAKHVKLVLGVGIAALVAGVALAQTPAIKAALVRDVDNPDRLPGFTDFMAVNIPAGDNEAQVCSDRVPEGKILVLDQVSLGVNAPTGESPKAVIGREAVGTVLAYLPLTDAGPSSGDLNYWVGVWQLRGVRFGPAEQACIVLWRYPVSGRIVPATATLTGHLIDR